MRITKESSIAAGVRRIEAVCGKAAEDFVYHNEDLAQQASALLKTTLPALPSKVSALLDEHKELSQQLKTLKRGSLKELAETLAKRAVRIGSVHFLAEIVDLDQEGLLLLADDLMSKQPSMILVLALKLSDRCQLLVRVSPDLTSKKISAQELIKEIAPLVKGSGGGKPDSAQAGGKDPSGINNAFETAKRYVEKLCNS